MQPILRHFKPAEFACKCGKCGKGYHDMDKHVMLALDNARGIAGIPFALTSPMRCPAHNKAIGGTEDSSHLRGYAVDIDAPNSRARFQIIEALIGAGFTRLGVAHDFIHADMDPDKAEDVLWTY